MKTKFTLLSYLLALLILALLYIVFTFVPSLFIDPYYDGKLFLKVFLPSIFILSIFFLVIGELKNKCIQLRIENDQLVVKRFWGLQTGIIKKSEIDGWKLSHQTYNHSKREFIFIIKNNNTAATISESYHKNYFEIKAQIQNKFEYLGYEKFSHIKDFKEMLTWY